MFLRYGSGEQDNAQQNLTDGCGRAGGHITELATHGAGPIFRSGRVMPITKRGKPVLDKQPGEEDSLKYQSSMEDMQS